MCIKVTYKLHSNYVFQLVDNVQGSDLKKNYIKRYIYTYKTREMQKNPNEKKPKPQKNQTQTKPKLKNLEVDGLMTSSITTK